MTNDEAARRGRKDITPTGYALGHALKNAAAEAGVAQVEIGRRTGIDKKQINLWFNGHEVMNLTELERVAAVIGVDPLRMYANAQAAARADEARRLAERTEAVRRTA